MLCYDINVKFAIQFNSIMSFFRNRSYKQAKT